MNITFEAACAYPLFHPEISGTIGGAERQLFLIANALREHFLGEYEVTFLIGDHGQSKSETVHGIRLLRTFRLDAGRIGKLFRLLLALYQAHADVYIFRSPTLAVFFGCVFVRYFLRKHFIYMVAHDVETDTIRLADTIGRLATIGMRWTYRYASALTTQSIYQQERFKEKNRRVVLFPNIFPTKDSCFRRDDVIGKGSFTVSVLWVGRCVRWKRPEIFIELARNHPEISFRMILPEQADDRVYRKSIVKLAKNLKNLTILGSVPPDAMDWYYRTADIYVMTSESEGFSNTMMEAMDARCTILSLTVNPDGIFDTGTIGICAYDNRIDFYTIFTQLLTDTIRCQQLGNAAHDYLHAHHAAHNLVPRFDILLHSLDS